MLHVCIIKLSPITCMISLTRLYSLNVFDKLHPFTSSISTMCHVRLLDLDIGVYKIVHNIKFVDCYRSHSG